MDKIEKLVFEKKIKCPKCKNTDIKFYVIAKDYLHLLCEKCEHWACDVFEKDLLEKWGKNGKN